jgi:uncharacterized protein with HEPN domain
MNAEDRVRLRHMVEAADAAMGFMAGRTRADLDTDLMLAFAVVRAIGIVGEAAHHVSHETRALLPALPWPAIVGMRHRLVHAYFQIDLETVWKTLTQELAPLREAVQQAIDRG